MVGGVDCINAPILRRSGMPVEVYVGTGNWHYMVVGVMQGAINRHLINCHDILRKKLPDVF